MDAASGGKVGMPTVVTSALACCLAKPICDMSASFTESLLLQHSRALELTTRMKT